MENLVLIHGALGSQEEFNGIVKLLEKQYNLFLYEIPHHGNKRDSQIPFTIQELSNDFLSYLETIGPSYVYGFSLGGYIALVAAQKDESNFKGIVTQGTKFNWNKTTVKKEIKLVNEDFLQEKSLSFYTYLRLLHGYNLPILFSKMRKLLVDLGKYPPISTENIKHLSIPVRITRGGKDKMVTQQESKEISESIQNSFYFEIPSMIHPLGFIKPKFIARLIDVQIKSFSYKWTQTPYGKMAYKIYGEIEDEKKPILLFLHEAIGSIAQWDTFPEHLCKSLNIPGITLEFPGYGFSDEDTTIRDENYLHEFALTVLPSFLASIQLKNPLIIVGHSDGGTNTLLYSTAHPQNIKAIITMAAHYINEPETRAGIQPAIDAYTAGKLKGLEFFHGSKTERLFYAWANTWNLPGFIDWNISDDIRGNSIPALVIQGDKDQYGTEQQVYGITSLLENATPLLISNCGHQPFLDQEEIVIEKIKNWLNSLTILN